jgi:hypothetical protein
MQVTGDSVFNRTEHNRIISTIPRRRTKHSSKMQSRYAAALASLAAQGIRFAKPDQSLYLLGYKHGMNAAMRWPEQAKPEPGSTTDKRKKQAKTVPIVRDSVLASDTTTPAK